jgi:hypothetical protein
MMSNKIKRNELVEAIHKQPVKHTLATVFFGAYKGPFLDINKDKIYGCREVTYRKVMRPSSKYEA